MIFSIKEKSIILTHTAVAATNLLLATGFVVQGQVDSIFHYINISLIIKKYNVIQLLINLFLYLIYMHNYTMAIFY